MIKDAKESIKAQLLAFKSRISIKEPNILYHIYTTYLRCLLIYHMTPLLGAGILKPDCIRQVEMLCLRRLLRLPNDIKSDVIRNLSSQYQRPTLELIEELDQRAMIKVTKQPKLESYINNEQEISQKTTRRRNRVLYIERRILDLILAVSQKRTVIYHNHRHYCKIHQTIVNEHHMKECDPRQISGDLTRFNETLEKNDFSILVIH